MVPPLGSHGNKASFTILSNNACCSCNIDEAKIHLNLPKRCYPSRCTFHDSGSALEFYLTPRHNITSAVSANWWSFQVRTQHKYVSSQSQWSEDGIYRKQSRWFFRDQQPDIESGLPTGLHTGFIAVVTTCVFPWATKLVLFIFGKLLQLFWFLFLLFWHLSTAKMAFWEREKKVEIFSGEIVHPKLVRDSNSQRKMIQVGLSEWCGQPHALPNKTWGGREWNEFETKVTPSSWLLCVFPHQHTPSKNKGLLRPFHY